MTRPPMTRPPSSSPMTPKAKNGLLIPRVSAAFRKAGAVSTTLSKAAWHTTLEARKVEHSERDRSRSSRRDHSLCREQSQAREPTAKSRDEDSNPENYTAGSDAKPQEMSDDNDEIHHGVRNVWKLA